MWVEEWSFLEVWYSAGRRDLEIQLCLWPKEESKGKHSEVVLQLSAVWADVTYVFGVFQTQHDRNECSVWDVLHSVQKLSLRFLSWRQREKLIQALWRTESWVTILVMLGEVTKSLVRDQVLVRIWHERGRLQINLSQGNWGLPVELTHCWMGLTGGVWECEKYLQK